MFEPAYTERDIDLILDAIQSIVQERITTHMTRRDIAFWDYFKMHIDYQLGYQTSLPILKHKNKYPERPLDLKDYINRCRDALDITFMEIESDYKQFQEKNDHMANKVEAIIDEEMGLN